MWAIAVVVMCAFVVGYWLSRSEAPTEPRVTAEQLITEAERMEGPPTDEQARAIVDCLALELEASYPDAARELRRLTDEPPAPDESGFFVVGGSVNSLCILAAQHHTAQGGRAFDHLERLWSLLVRRRPRASSSHFAAGA